MFRSTTITTTKPLFAEQANYSDSLARRIKNKKSQKIGLTLELMCKEYSLLYMEVKVLVAQSCPTLCNPMDCTLPGSSVHGISQASLLEWVAISFSRGSSQPRDWTRVSYKSLALQTDSLPLSYLGSPYQIAIHVSLNNKEQIKHGRTTERGGHLTENVTVD